jgi:hypothetical protein
MVGGPVSLGKFTGFYRGTQLQADLQALCSKLVEI